MTNQELAKLSQGAMLIMPKSALDDAIRRGLRHGFMLGFGMGVCVASLVAVASAMLAGLV